MRNNRLRSLGAALLVAALTLLFFWKLIFTNLILVGVDSFLYFYPYKAYVAQALRDGRLPLWNPHLFMGVPLLANMQTAILYPLNWPLVWLPAPQQVAASIVVHVTLAGWGVLAFARRSLKLGWWGTLTAALIFALGGFTGATVEHINQLNVIAWLPWAFFLVDVSAENRRKVTPTLGLGVVIALMILAGHAQATYICLLGVGMYTLVGGFGQLIINRGQTSASTSPFRSRTCIAVWRAYIAERLPYFWVFVSAIAMAILLAAAQLLPTLELSRLSVRSGGLPYREVVSFSLRPWHLHYTLLPPFGVDLSQVFGEAFSEYVAYIGVLGLGLVTFGLLSAWRRRPGTHFWALLAAAGLFLGLGAFNPVYFLLYKIMPGFDLFRAPARWMLLYSFGTAMLAGVGMDEMANLRIPRFQPLIRGLQAPILFLLLGTELFLASRSLRYNQPTAPEAFTFLRPSVAHLKTDPGLGRFLSLSGIVYDPGDLAEMYAIFGRQLPEKAIYDYVVAAKEKEVLFYNLPLLYGLYSVDGYDGGLLPLRDFVTMERLFLDEEDLSVDGRLRENLRDVPPGQLLSLLGVKYVITDKVFDVWIDGLFYDLQFPARLRASGVPEVNTNDLPDFPTTALGLISHLEGASDLPDGTPVARITVTDERGWSETFDLLAGFDTSEGRYEGDVAHRQAQVGYASGDNSGPSYYVKLILIGAPRRLVTISVQSLAPAGEFVLRGLSLVDTRTNTSRQVTLSTQGYYRLVHSGDVKIYENLDVLPRAFVVHKAEVIPDAEETIARLREPAFAPAQTVILAEGKSLSGEGVGVADIVHYAPEEVIIDATSDTAGYLLLTDTFYPGWEATVDGQRAEILRADVSFRAIRLEPGTHEVVFRYRPVSVRLGAWVSGLGVLLCLAGLAWSTRRQQNIPG